MRILILSWRDSLNPKSGGAEAVLLRYACHWIAKGHVVFWLGNEFKDGKPSDQISGLHIYRVGPELPFYNSGLMLMAYPLFVLASLYRGWQLARELKPDLVIDAIHGLPMFSPLFFSGCKALFVCEVAGTIWDKMYPFPISLIGKLLEKFVYWLYRDCEIWAISENTKKDILQINANLIVKVVPLGIDTSEFKPLKKFPFPSAVFVARLVKMKGIESALSAAKQIAQKLPNFKLFVVGGGNADYVASLDHGPYVKYMGRVDDKTRNRLYAKCHFLIHPSYKEGFGLTVLEAAASGTPTIARRGSSMDELIISGRDGLLFDQDSQISESFLRHFDTPGYAKLTRSAKEKAKSYDWREILKNEKLV